MTDLFWMLLGAATVVAGQVIGRRLALLEARSMPADTAPPADREATYREPAPALERQFTCEWSPGGGGFCGEPCGPLGLCAHHEARLRRVLPGSCCGDPKCPSNNRVSPEPTCSVCGRRGLLCKSLDGPWFCGEHIDRAPVSRRAHR